MKIFKIFRMPHVHPRSFEQNQSTHIHKLSEYGHLGSRFHAALDAKCESPFTLPKIYSILNKAVVFNYSFFFLSHHKHTLNYLSWKANVVLCTIYPDKTEFKIFHSDMAEITHTFVLLS